MSGSARKEQEGQPAMPATRADIPISPWAIKLEAGVTTNGGPVPFAQLTLEDFRIRIGGTSVTESETGITTLHSANGEVGLELETDAQGNLHGRYVTDGRLSISLDGRMAVLTGNAVGLKSPDPAAYVTDTIILNRGNFGSLNPAPSSFLFDTLEGQDLLAMLQ